MLTIRGLHHEIGNGLSVVNTLSKCLIHLSHDIVTWDVDCEVSTTYCWSPQ